MDLSNAHWRKSSHSGGTGSNCVEVTGLPGIIAIRDSKNPDGPPLLLTPEAWTGLLNHIRTM